MEEKQEKKLNFDGLERKNPRPRPTNRPRPQGDLKIIPLGGVEEIGINCTVYEYNNEIILVDLGLGFSEFDYYGIDAVVPDIKYLTPKKKKIKGIFVTHGHLDHIGAFPYLIEDLGFPHVYGSKFTIKMIEQRLNEDPSLLPKMQNKLHTVEEKDVLRLGSFKLEFFHVNHSIPQCLGVCIQTPTARVVHTGDFKFDNSPINEPVANFGKIVEFGNRGVDVLLADSTNSLKKGYPVSESDVAKNLEDAIERADGRVIIGTFSGLVGRLYQLIEIARKQGKKVAVAGFSMEKTLTLAQEIGYIKIPPGLLIPMKEVNKYDPSKVLILTTGAQGEPEAALSKMSAEDYKGFQIQKGDTIIISAKTIPGNDRAVQLMVDNITRRGAVVVQLDEMDLFTSGHGYQEDQKIMLNLVKPKFFMPVHGYQYFLRAHAETAVKVGVPRQNVIISQRGCVIEGNRFKGFKITKKFPCEPLIVSGSGVGDVGTVVLREREQMANYGMIIISLMADKERKLIRSPFVLTRGFVYVKSNQELLQFIADSTEKIYTNAVKENSDNNTVKDKITTEIGKLVYKETEREPIIMTILNYV
ncbi:ribonuclease J [Candidatus Dojkabacteria bacterium]|nr:ribonuclease J [Candidatus Dojkabacteria bacterium]